MQRSRKIRERKDGDVVTQTLRIHLIVESAHRLADLRQQTSLATRLGLTAARVGRIAARFICMRVKATDRAEEDLALHGNAGRVLDLDQLGNLPQLISQRRAGKSCCVGRSRNRRIRLVQSLIGC